MNTPCPDTGEKYTPSNEKPKKELYGKLKSMMGKLGMHEGHLLPHHAHLYVVDTRFLPSIGAVNPALTTTANALRVGDHLHERLGA